MRKFEEILEIAADFLNSEKIPYMFVGAIAIGYYGIPRTTQDIDVLVVIPRDKIRIFADFFQSRDFYCPAEDIEIAFAEKSHFGAYDNQSPFRIDIKGIYNEFDQQSFLRRVQVESFNRKIWLCTPEDAIVSKLMYGSPKDILDVKGILLRLNDKLDYDYLTKYSKVYKVGQAYRKILQEVSKIETK